MNDEEKSLSELIEEWQDQNKIHRYEGTSGVSNLEKLFGVLGYKEGNYLGYGNEIINFLSDNPGAIQAILEWIGEREVPEWKENIISELEENEPEN